MTSAVRQREFPRLKIIAENFTPQEFSLKLEKHTACLPSLQGRKLKVQFGENVFSCFDSAPVILLMAQWDERAELSKKCCTCSFELRASSLVLCPLSLPPSLNHSKRCFLGHPSSSKEERKRGKRRGCRRRSSLMPSLFVDGMREFNQCAGRGGRSRGQMSK